VVSKTCSQHQDALPTFEANTRFTAASFPLCHTVFAKLVTAISRTPWQEKLPFRDTLSEHPGLAAGMRLARATNLRPAVFCTSLHQRTYELGPKHNATFLISCLLIRGIITPQNHSRKSAIMNGMWTTNDALQAVWGPGFNIGNLAVSQISSCEHGTTGINIIRVIFLGMRVDPGTWVCIPDYCGRSTREIIGTKMYI
jgi:hypothetical protein